MVESILRERLQGFGRNPQYPKRSFEGGFRGNIPEK
jgi:hypothetical protein